MDTPTGPSWESWEPFRPVLERHFLDDNLPFDAMADFMDRVYDLRAT